MEYMDVDQLVAALRISKPSLYRMTSQKLIPFIKLGQRVLFDQEKIKEWLEGKEVEVEDDDE